MNKDKVITFLTPGLAGGGAEKFSVSIANKLHDRGYNIEFLSFKAGGKNKKLLSKKIKYTTFGRAGIVKNIIPLYKYVKKNKESVYISNIGHMNVAILLVAFFLGISKRVIVREANVFSINSRKVGYLKRVTIEFLMKRLYPSAKAVVCVSECVKNDLVKTLALKSNNVTSVYNIVGDQAQEKSVDPWLESTDSPVIVAVGRLEKQKNYALALDALNCVNKSVRCRLLILGEGSLRDELESYIKREDLGDIIRLAGYVDNPIDYMRKADMFLMTSNNEGLPGAMIQAFMNDIPIVSTDCLCGPSEVLQDGRFGSLVPVGDVEAVTQAIISNIGKKIEKTSDLEEHKAVFSDEMVVSKWINLINQCDTLKY